MDVRIEIERVEFEDDLRRQAWGFYIGNLDYGHANVRLAFWANETRQSRRHKWRATGRYFDLYARQGDSIPSSEVPLPDDVIRELGEKAAQRVAAMILDGVQKLREREG